MASSSSTTGLNRSRSLRQPTAGLSQAQRKDEDKKDAPRLADKLRQLRSKGLGVPASSVPAPAAAEPGSMSPSRLPKPGGTSTATKTRAGMSGPGGSGIATRSRPNSGVFGLGRSDSTAARKPVTQNISKEEAETTRTARPTASATTRLARPTSTSSFTSKPSSGIASRPSPTSTTSPALASSTARPIAPRTTRPRPKSTATALTSTTATRPPRPPSAGSIASTSTIATTTSASTVASKRPVARANTTAVTRASHGVSKPASTSVDPTPLNATSSSIANATARPPRKTATEDVPRLRPAFTTLQQHYSPARNVAPKPLTSTYLAPPTPSKHPANVAISSETARLQTELLQLHLLHRDADKVITSWQASARDRLGRRFAELAEEDAEVRREEAEAEEARNVAALRAWAVSGGTKALEDKVQILDGLLSGLWKLSEPGGRYARAVRTFEKWADQMTVAVEARRQAGGLGALMQSGEVAFVGELDGAWRDEVASLARKLDGWRRQLSRLEDGLPDEEVGEGERASSLARILGGCRSQVCDMLAELDVIEQIERDAIAQEAAWIKRMSREDEIDDTPRAGAIWRRF